MPTQDVGLASIRKAFFLDHGSAAGAEGIFKRARFGGPGRKRNLGKLLRHHDERQISDAETWDRDGFDFLLAYFGMVEVGCLSGFVGLDLPEDYRADAVEILGDGDVRRYYEDHYPIYLPQAHFRRLQGRPIGGDRGVMEIGPDLFDQFFTISQPLEIGSEIETFLWFLDGGARDGSDIDDVVEALSRPDRFLEHLAARADDEEDGELPALSAAVQGFPRFLDFSDSLLRLLHLGRDFPILQSAMWHYHGYWLGQLAQHMGSDLRRIQKAMTSWQGLIDSKSRPEPWVRQERISTDAIAWLSSGRFSFPLIEALLSEGVDGRLPPIRRN